MGYIEAAQKFVKKMKLLFDIDINIINDKGIIIASSQLERIGDFHEMAYHMIENNIEYTYNDSDSTDLAGVRTGVNMLLRQSRLPYKVIGITGLVEENRTMIKVMKYYFELLNDSATSLQVPYAVQRDDLAFSLFFERPCNYAKINNMFDKMHRNPNALRLPILISLHDNTDTTKLYYRLKNHFSDTQQHLIFIINSYEILFYMAVSYNEIPQSAVSEVCRSLQSFSENKAKYAIFHTLPSDDITTYFLSYCQLMWLKKLSPSASSVPCSIIDHLDLLLLSSHNPDNYAPLLLYYKQLMIHKNLLEDFKRIFGALIRGNMSYAQAADILFVHKNTVIFHMNKLKAALGLDPFKQPSHRFLLYYVYNYVCIENKEIPSFQDFYDKFNSR